tara:strand:- start:1433 stop:2878 length:1446 start_codon:yes stop_codon:yes gene_type:complete
MLKLLQRCFVLLHIFIPVLWKFYVYNDFLSLCNAISDAGPLWIKLAQWLSVRYDILPPLLCNHLKTLQNNIKYHSSEYSIQTIEHDFGKPLKSIFQSFNKDPLDSGSIAQVHEAILLNGKKVVVKIIHPDVKLQLELDQQILVFINYWSPIDLIPIMKQIQKQTDLRTESRNLKILRTNFKKVQHIYFPKVICASSQVLIQEKMQGLTETTFIKKYPDKKDELQLLKLVAFYKMVCRDKFVHGDMHPGNILAWVDRSKKVNMSLVDPSPSTKMRKSKRLMLGSFTKILSCNPRIIGDLLLKCNVNEFARVNKFKRLTSKLPNDFENISALQKSLFDSLRSCKIIISGEIAFLVLNYFLVNGNLQNYKLMHMRVIMYIMQHKLFKFDKIFGQNFEAYLQQNIHHLPKEFIEELIQNTNISRENKENKENDSSEISSDEKECNETNIIQQRIITIPNKNVEIQTDILSNDDASCEDLSSDDEN